MSLGPVTIRSTDSFVSFCVHAPSVLRVTGAFSIVPHLFAIVVHLLRANFCFMSTSHDRRRFDTSCRYNTPHCFHTLWAVLALVTPALRGRIRSLVQHELGDLLFSLSREFVRRLI